MKRIVSLLAAIMLGFASYATIPGSYVVLKSANVTNISAYTKAVEVADLEPFRYLDKRTVIKFDNGVEIELLSAKELLGQGKTLATGNYKTSDPANWIAPVFHLNPDGTLVASYTKPDVKQNTIVK